MKKMGVSEHTLLIIMLLILGLLILFIYYEGGIKLIKDVLLKSFNG
jgi:hypothetical protein